MKEPTTAEIQDDYDNNIRYSEHASIPILLKRLEAAEATKLKFSQTIIRMTEEYGTVCEAHEKLDATLKAVGDALDVAEKTYSHLSAMAVMSGIRDVLNKVD